MGNLGFDHLRPSAALIVQSCSTLSPSSANCNNAGDRLGSGDTYSTWEGHERDCFRSTGTRTAKTVIFDPGVALKKHCLLKWSAARKYVELLNDGSEFFLTLESFKAPHDLAPRGTRGHLFGSKQLSNP